MSQNIEAKTFPPISEEPVHRVFSIDRIEIFGFRVIMMKPNFILRYKRILEVLRISINGHKIAGSLNPTLLYRHEGITFS